MKPLYLSETVRNGLGTCLRPGGSALTERILELLTPNCNSRLLDAGCGTGASMTILQERGFKRCVGIDLSYDLLGEARRKGQTVLQGNVARLPLADENFDILFCECVWNLTAKKQTLAEFARVLKPGGMLAIADIYARADAGSESRSWPVTCCFSQATDQATVKEQITEAGFTVTVVEDHTRLLNKTAAEFVFAHGSLQGFWQAVTGSAELAAAACNASAATRPGLFLLLAQRNRP